MERLASLARHVVTCGGPVAAVTAAGFPELGVSDWEAYEELAVALATDPARLRALQQGLSAARTTSPLFDTPRSANLAP